MRNSVHAGATSPQVPKWKAGVTIGNKMNVFVRLLQGLDGEDMELFTTSSHQVTKLHGKFPLLLLMKILSNGET